MLILFCRLNNADKKKNKIFASLKKNERDKKKLLDTVLKQLRSLVNGSTQHVQG
jgi:single-stranded DNA-specific DHH superfamily exonuclease